MTRSAPTGDPFKDDAVLMAVYLRWHERRVWALQHLYELAARRHARAKEDLERADPETARALDSTVHGIRGA